MFIETPPTSEQFVSLLSTDIEGLMQAPTSGAATDDHMSVLFLEFASIQWHPDLRFAWDSCLGISFKRCPAALFPNLGDDGVGASPRWWHLRMIPKTDRSLPVFEHLCGRPVIHAFYIVVTFCNEGLDLDP